MQEFKHLDDERILFLASIMLANQNQRVYPFEGTDNPNYRDYMDRQETHIKEMMKIVVRCYHDTYLPLLRGHEALQNKE